MTGSTEPWGRRRTGPQGRIREEEKKVDGMMVKNGKENEGE